MARKTVQRCSFALGDLQFDYLWERKNVKNMNLRVKPGGEVTVSTPTHVTQQMLERFLASKATFLQDALERMQSKAAEPRLALCEGESIPVWGAFHTVVHQKATKRGAFCENGCLVLSLRDPSNEQERKKTFLDFLKKQSERVLAPLTAELAPAILPAGQGMPQLSYRHMKSRWGSCAYRQNRICYNTRLAYLPVACARLVACHELTHFWHHDHSVAFYRRLGQVLPEHRQLRAALKKTAIPRFTWD